MNFVHIALQNVKVFDIMMSLSIRFKVRVLLFCVIIQIKC